MKNLENYGVQELNAKEVTDIDGGLVELLLLNALSTMAFYGAFMAGYNAGAAA